MNSLIIALAIVLVLIPGAFAQQWRRPNNNNNNNNNINNIKAKPTKRVSQMSENERVAYWHQHTKEWPHIWHNETPGHIQKNIEREAEIMSIPGARERWENWMQFVSGQMVPKFTDVGFKLINTPAHVQAKLKAALDQALENFEDIPIEGEELKLIYGPLPPRFLNIGDLAWEINRDLKALNEEWAGGIELEGTSSYGIRLYQNGSALGMHYDKIETHVISSIVHVGHEYDDDNHPWPIQIDDHFGNIHSVNLEPGQMLFYESARQLHGRMSAFRGKYYASIFTHYRPKDRKIWSYSRDDVIGAVPPHWADGVVEDVGSRWAGQILTIDSLACDGAPPRTIKGQFIHDRKSSFASAGHSEL